MAQYSFIVKALDPVGIPRPMVVLDRGLNVFSAEIDDLDEFLALLQSEQVQVLEAHHLGVGEANSPQDLHEINRLGSG